MAREIDNIAMVRRQQLFPLTTEALIEVLKTDGELQDVMWCQEEPMNQGAWYQSQHHMRRIIYEHDRQLSLTYVGREPSAAPAAGYPSVHLEEQKRFINQALNI